ncbi:MAG: DNA mismatch repair protein MutS [Clostridia bacterium]|nr:DNA mismatch repair protein MutS [Clostridia bacterium]
MNKMYITLEYDKILEKLASFAQSEKVKEKIAKLEPYQDEMLVTTHITETSDARQIIENYGTPPIVSMSHLNDILKAIEKGEMLSPEDLYNIRLFLTACRRMKSYLLKAESSNHELAFIGRGMELIDEVESEIDRCIRNNAVDSKATIELYGMIKKTESLHEKIKDKLNSMLASHSHYYSDSYIVKRGNHFTLPVKKEFKKQVEGIVYDMSNSGNTVFVEPKAVTRFNEQLTMLEIETDNEIRKILYTLTGLCETYLTVIRLNIEVMESLDFAFAKAKLSMSMNGYASEIVNHPYIKIREGIHPLLDQENVVPLDFELGNHQSCLIITGPNTGGKTVALKTVGLFSLMLQSGLHIPAKESRFCLFNHVLCDIGDGQSISENLSTFSSHMKNIIDILAKADENSLVLLDELGSGTDPAEGMGLAVAILEKLKTINCLAVATTHYPEIKIFAKETEGFVNARMAFDRENMKPLYKMEIGEAGESCALYIAEKLGLDMNLVNRAKEVSYQGDMTKDFIIPISEFQIQTEEVTSAKAKKKTEYKKEIEKTVSDKFVIGDCVIVYPQKEIGIIFDVNAKDGNFGVKIKNRKTYVNHKRLKLNIEAKDLYPDNYDFDVIFDTVANRKANKKMNKRHDPSVVIVREEVERKP